MHTYSTKLKHFLGVFNRQDQNTAVTYIKKRAMADFQVQTCSPLGDRKALMCLCLLENEIIHHFGLPTIGPGPSKERACMELYQGKGVSS